jgi:hypothetical protein
MIVDLSPYKKSQKEIVSHLTWNAPRQHAAEAANELAGNELAVTQNIVVVC